LSTTYSPRNRSYYEQQVLGKSPEELVLLAYDLGVTGCRRKDRALVRDVLTELVAALDLSQPMAANFLVLYDYALREVRENRFEQPERILSGLREAWKQALDSRLALAGAASQSGIAEAA
jgi:flagellin-specific chaperone FliS